MNSGDCVEYLTYKELPPSLNFNLSKTEIIDFNKINFNDYTINILRQKRHKYLLTLTGYDKYLENIIEIANKEKPLKQLDDVN